MYSMGGWITMPGSCSSGFRSRPSAAAGSRRSNGLEVNSMNSRKPTLIMAITESMRASISRGKCRLNTVTASIHTVSISTHSSSEPSWLPQVAAKRYCTGRLELELLATLSTEKSLPTKDQARQPNAIATNTNCPCAAGRATAIHAALPR